MVSAGIELTHPIYVALLNRKKNNKKSLAVGVEPVAHATG